MKHGIHPPMFPIKLVMLNSKVIETRSACQLGTIRLESDPSVHPAWTGAVAGSAATTSRYAKFVKRHGNVFGSAFGGPPLSDDSPEDSDDASGTKDQ